MPTDAIHTDVSTEEETQTAAPVLSERELAMQAIQQEIATQYDEPAPVVEEPEQAEPAPAATPTPEEVKVRVKVDGIEQEISQADLIKGYQKDSVASKRLEQAAQRQRDLDAKEALLAERERQITAQVATPSAEDEDIDTAAVVNALVEGDNEGAERLLREAILKGRTVATPAMPAPDPAEIAAKVKAELEVDRAAREQAQIFKEFAAVNPMFDQPAEGEPLSPQRVLGDHTFDTVYGPMFERGEISYREALDKTAAYVATVFAPPPSAPVVSEREARKSKIDNLPVASGAKMASMVKETTVVDTLDSMAKARGQAGFI
jgi:hypothetical protein